MRRLLLVLAVLCAAIAGCSESTSTTATNSASGSHQKQTEDICRRYMREQLKLGRQVRITAQSSPDELVKAFSVFSDLMSRMGTDLERVDFPAQEREQFEQMRGEIRDMARAYDDAAQAARRADGAKLRTAMNALQAASRASDASARELELDDCVSGPPAPEPTRTAGVPNTDSIPKSQIGTPKRREMQGVARISIVPVGGAHREAKFLRKLLAARFALPVEVLPNIPIPPETIDPDRKQLNVAALTDAAREAFHLCCGHLTLISVTNVDVYDPGFSYDYVLGMRNIDAGYGLLSTARMRLPDSAGRPATDKLFRRRLLSYGLRQVGSMRYKISAEPVTGEQTSMDGLFGPVAGVNDLDTLETSLCPYRQLIDPRVRAELRCP